MVQDRARIFVHRVREKRTHSTLGITFTTCCKGYHEDNVKLLTEQLHIIRCGTIIALGYKGLTSSDTTTH